MVVNQFEDLRVWQAAMKQCGRVGELIKRPKFRDDRARCDEMNDVAISVAANISEGFLRHRDKEFNQFLRVSAGSNGEVRTCFIAVQERKYLPDDEATELIEGSNAIGRMIRRLQATLKL